MAGDVPIADGGENTKGTDAADDDPRLSAEYVRTIERDGADEGDVTLVGVVHDHPASSYRARTVAAAVDPAVLALELPPLAVPLFERYASDGATPPPTGGEMSAAIQATDADRTAGIDGPSPGFAARLARRLAAKGVSLATARSTIGRFARASGHAIACRLAATVATATARSPDLSAPRSHAVTASDPPAEQASDERRQVRLARSVAAAFGADRAVATRDATREAHMVGQLAALAAEGDVVAVLGVDHLEPVARRLDERP